MQHASVLAAPYVGPLFHFDRSNMTIADGWTGDFYLNSSLYVKDNVRLSVVSTEYGGDVNRLFLVSLCRAQQ